MDRGGSLSITIHGASAGIRGVATRQRGNESGIMRGAFTEWRVKTKSSPISRDRWTTTDEDLLPSVGDDDDVRLKFIDHPQIFGEGEIESAIGRAIRPVTQYPVNHSALRRRPRRRWTIGWVRLENVGSATEMVSGVKSARYHHNPGCRS
ncbi:PREDICTED: uncharacterized protein LOC105149079 isoform X2 [Acromyrmex echinatior]|uniref:uncharacterized protein LOC105149079 isoform X2 n=1 Tax=Acromyrmex echinatior TaxID=103372 RepID=UPI000580E4DA|nr:PREDICTED: uncharacterized protein LOC105149079 isoform X2 [Acromyrmex echinatior]